MKKINVIVFAALILLTISIHSFSADNPNVILIFVDDMGYGDLGCYGSTKNRTPNLDQMAKEGIRFTDFYSACSVCSPSRAALMTGCYPQRVNLHEDENGKCVLFPGSVKGLNPDEITIAEVLKKQGYVTACIGKWHLGDHPDFLPTKQGFDYYYGIPYSNDMDRENIPLPMMRNETVVEAPVHQPTITRRYTAETINFIKKNKSHPFFIYLPHAMVHLPLHASEQFKGKSANGIYGDAVEEIDWSTGEIIKILKELNLDQNTLIIFTSDNGSTGRNGGSNLPLSGHKGQTMEGGMRIPCIMRYPSLIPAGQISSVLTGTIDMMPTIANLAGTSAPGDRIIDGRDITALMKGKTVNEPLHKAYFYYQIDQLQCIRSGKWKLHIPQESRRKNWGKPDRNTPLMLFDLEKDISEKNNLAAQYPEVVAKLMELADPVRMTLGDSGRNGSEQRPAGMVDKPYPQLLK